jgi:hypothetical protein
MGADGDGLADRRLSPGLIGKKSLIFDKSCNYFA